MLIGELVRKWFGLAEPVCKTCEVLQVQLADSERERKLLLEKLLSPHINLPIEANEKDEIQPIHIGKKVIPWSVRQAALENEDRQTAKLMKAKQEEIDRLAQEMKIDLPPAMSTTGE